MSAPDERTETREPDGRLRQSIERFGEIIKVSTVCYPGECAICGDPVNAGGVLCDHCGGPVDGPPAEQETERMSGAERAGESFGEAIAPEPAAWIHSTATARSAPVPPARGFGAWSGSGAERRPIEVSRAEAAIICEALDRYACGAWRSNSAAVATALARWRAFYVGPAIKPSGPTLSPMDREILAALSPQDRRSRAILAPPLLTILRAAIAPALPWIAAAALIPERLRRRRARADERAAGLLEYRAIWETARRSVDGSDGAER